MTSPTNAYCFFCHRLSPPITNEFEKISIAAQDSGEAFLLFHVQNEQPPAELANYNYFPFTYESLANLHYPTFGKKLNPGHNHFPAFQFFRDYPDFDYYWVIEYDVRFSGNWRDFFQYFQTVDADLATCLIVDYKPSIEKWMWWPTLKHPTESIPLPEYIRSLNAIYRVSNAAITFLDQAMRDGWHGHHEVLLPTLLKRNGFQMLDMGGNGQYTPPDMIHRFYDHSTMRVTPPIWKYGRRKNKLYHPVKALRWVLRGYLSYFVFKIRGPAKEYIYPQGTLGQDQ